MVRSFLAIDLPDRQKNTISQAVETWRRYRAAVRWTAVSRLHLTLKFLGDVPETAIGEIAEACRQAASRHRAFELKLTVTGIFPSLKRPRILWVGLGPVQEGALHGLQQEIEQMLEDAGFPREKKPFSPHITVGRVKSGKNLRPLIEEFMRYEPDPAPFSMDSFTLYSSTLTPRGPIYRELERFVLAEKS